MDLLNLQRSDNRPTSTAVVAAAGRDDGRIPTKPFRQLLPAPKHVSLHTTHVYISPMQYEKEGPGTGL